MELPKEFCERMKQLTGNEYDDFLTSYETQINRGVRINPLKYDGGGALADVFASSERVEWCADGFYAASEELNGNHPYHCAGAFYFQEPSAMSSAEGLPIAEGDTVLDLCAAPGGKTTQLGAKLKNTGLLVSNEIVPKRAAILSENVERMGLTNTVVTNESPSRFAERFPAFFDKIMVDAPCSGEGMFRKEPQAIDEWSVAHTLSCGVRQKNILDDAYKMLKCGGYIMYSTCTFSYDENEAVVRYMMDKYGMELCEIPQLGMLSDGIGEGMVNCRRIFPHKNKGEGHFAALLRKTEPTAEYKPPKKRSGKPNTALENAVKLYREFEKKTLKRTVEGEFVLFGDNLYLLPTAVDLSKIKVVRCGLHLGVVKPKRFEPSHALSHAFNVEDYLYKVEIPSNSDEVKRYLHGEVINGDGSGRCVVCTDGLVLGWGKAVDGVVKNHYPKHLRTR